ncbi:MAG: alpha/beta fold hydrolase [Actinomycetota bacterium]
MNLPGPARALAARARDLLRPIDWRGSRPHPEDVRGAFLFDKDRSVASFDGTEIAYTVLGTRGPWVALVPGFVCPDSHWRYLAPDLARHHRVVVWDLRGLGLSGTPRPAGYRARNLRPQDFAIEALARDLEAVLDDAGAGRAALIGHSMGGQTILEAYRRFPKRVTTLVFVTAPHESPMRMFYGRDVTALTRAMDRAVRLLPRPVPVLAWRALLLADPSVPHRLAQLVRALGPEARVEDMEAYYRHLGLLDPLVVLHMAEAMRAHSGADVLPTVRVPALVVAADLDGFCPLGVAEATAEGIPGAELAVVEGAAHGAIVEKPQEINAAVRGFLERHLRRPERERGPRRAPARSADRRVKSSRS